MSTPKGDTLKTRDSARNVRWDNYKALLALLMVYGHTFRTINSAFPKMGGVFVFIYLFHMPAFLFVSGMFSKKAADHCDMRRAVSLFLQYLLVKFVLFFAGMATDQISSTTSFFSESGVAWFALTTMECLLLTMLLRKVKKSYVFVLSILIGCLGGFCTDIGTFLSLSRTFVYFPYFYLGYCLQSGDLEKTADKLWVKLCSLGVLAAAFFLLVKNAGAVYPFSEFIKAKGPYSDYADILPQTGLGALYRVILYAAGFALVFACFFLIPKRKIPLISGIGSRTLSLYVFHYVLVELTYKNNCLQNFALAHFERTIGIALFYLAVSAGMAVIASLPPLERFARWVTAVPLRNTPKKHQAPPAKAVSGTQELPTEMEPQENPPSQDARENRGGQ